MPESRTPVFFHVGLTKAASTSLQRFFAAHGQVHFPDRFVTWQKLVARTALEYKPEVSRRYVQEEQEKARAGGRRLVFSHERLSGNPHSGHYDAKEIGDRIRSLHPEPRIILMIREQTTLMTSCYKQYVRFGGTRSLQDYLLPKWDGRIPLFNWRFYEYHRLVEYYFRTFGRSNVLVLCVEQLPRDSALIYRRLCGFLETEVLENVDLREVHNPALPDREVANRRFENRFSRHHTSISEPEPFDHLAVTSAVAKTLGRVERALRSPDRMDFLQRTRTLFAGKFARSNRVTASLLGMDLGDLGYEGETG